MIGRPGAKLNAVSVAEAWSTGCYPSSRSLGLISLIDLPKTAYVMWAATFIPVGAIDLGHWEHCKAMVTGKPLDGEVQSMNRLAQRGGPILLVIGTAIAILGVAVAVLASVC